MEPGLVYGEHPLHRFDLIRPPVSAVPPYPGVILFHGGGFARGRRHHVSSIARALAYRGFAVLNADYRLLPKTSMADIVDDAVAMTRYASARAAGYDVDPTRLATMGRSAGGHLALMAAYTGGVLIRTVVSESGPTDLDPVMWDGSVRGAVMKRFSRGTDTRTISPVHVVQADAPPTLLLHGCRDGNVPFAHARILQIRLEGLGVPVRLLALPRTGHNPLRWRWRTSFSVVCEWLMTKTCPVLADGVSGTAALQTRSTPPAPAGWPRSLRP